MAEQVRIEIGFDGGQSLSMLVSTESADELERGIGQDGSATLDAEDAHYIVNLRRVVYLRRFRREARVGFGVG
jgi:molybdopterin-binding protein